MSTVSAASSGIMPLSLISEHKAAQGGPPPVQPLSFATEKHPLVQAPKPTPNGMEPSPPLVPILPSSQPEPCPSLACGGVNESTNEDRSGGSIPEVNPSEPQPQPVAIPERPIPAEPAESLSTPDPPLCNATPVSSSPQSQSSTQGTAAPVPSTLETSSTPAQPSQPTQEPSVHSNTASSQVEAQESGLPQGKPQTQSEVQPENVPAKPNTEAEKTTIQSETEEQKPVKPECPPETSKSESQTEPPAQEQPVQSSQQQSKSETAPAHNTAAVSSTSGRQSKRTKNTNSGAEKKAAPATVVNTTPAPSETEGGDDKRTKRKRLPTQVYQSPIPELNMIAKMSKKENDKEKTAASDDKLIVFYRNEFLAVRNAEGGFYVCQAMQNVYKTSSRIRIRWLSQVANTDHYSPDFYDNTEFDCILTNLNLERIEKNKYRLPVVEEQRTQSILKRAIDVEKGVAPPEEATVTEEHPDGLDLSLYRNEDQLKKRKKGNRNKVNKKKIKKVAESESLKKSRELSKRKPAIEPKKVNPIVNQQKRVARLPGKVEKNVVQRIVAAKKLNRRKVVSSPVMNKAAPAAAPPPAVKEVAKKKEPSRAVPLKRKSSEPQPSPVPEKKVKPGASKTRNL